jgi:hypothetical protein
MVKLKIWYYTTIKTDDTEEKVFKSYPDEIEHDARKGKITLYKDSIETDVAGKYYSEDEE